MVIRFGIGRILASSVLFILIMLSIPAWAQTTTTISPGDIVVVFAHAFAFQAGPGGIIKVNPTTGAQTVIACNPGPPCLIPGTQGFFSEPVGLAIEPMGPNKGNIVVADRILPGV